MSDRQAEFLTRLERRQTRVGVIGLGYVGLPLIHAFVDAGFRTLGYDVDQRKIDALNRGESYIGHIPSQWLQSW
ncbi:MAG: nucleotide sugar dehydrogenase, partial [Planctomycetota bacterium]